MSIEDATAPEDAAVAAPAIPEVVISFDIDGTLEDGDPPGPLSMHHARSALALGYVVGSASDRTLGEQRRMWERHGITPHFVSHKHTLHHIAERFPSHRRVHVGDTDNDERFALAAGFEFVHVEEFPEAGTPGWIF
jgi:hypothetical protein